VGIGSPEQAVEACSVADGVIIGSTVVRRLVGGLETGTNGADAVRDLIAEYRAALDTAFPGN
jgi:tryptophan synthase alpha chain